MLLVASPPKIDEVLPPSPDLGSAPFQASVINIEADQHGRQPKQQLKDQTDEKANPAAHVPEDSERDERRDDEDAYCE